MLYWAEGTKIRNSLEIANSDPHLLVVALRFLRQEFPEDAKAVTLRLNAYTDNGLGIQEIERHWLSRLDLPASCLRRHTLNNRPAGSRGSRKSKLPFGVATLTLCRTQAAQHVWGGIQEYGTFVEPKWLDM